MINTKPKINHLEKGVIRCGGCGLKLLLDDFESLKMSKCPRCSSMGFIPKKIGDMWLCAPLGGGGMGSVYKAVSKRSRRLFAVKILPRNKERPELEKILFREGAAGRIIGKHRNLAAVIDMGSDEDESFLVSEFIQGVRLDLLIEEDDKLSERRTIDIARQLLEAEIHIVKKGFLYRDLKPQNVIIEKNGNVRLFDYGLCVSLEQARSPDPDDLEGSPYFIPPERVLAAPEGEYSEIYSLGMLMFYMLDGRNYYQDTSTTADLVLKHVKSARAASVANYFKHCHERTIQVIDKMIARNPTDRYQTLLELKNDLNGLSKLVKNKPLSTPSSLSDAMSSRASQFAGKTRPSRPLIPPQVVRMCVIAIVVFLIFSIYVICSNDLFALKVKSHVLQWFLNFLDTL